VVEVVALRKELFSGSSSVQLKKMLMNKLTNRFQVPKSLNISY